MLQLVNSLQPHPANITQLSAALEHALVDMPRQCLQNLTDFMLHHVAAIIQMKRRSTCY